MLSNKWAVECTLREEGATVVAPLIPSTYKIMTKISLFCFAAKWGKENRRTGITWGQPYEWELV